MSKWMIGAAFSAALVLAVGPVGAAPWKNITLNGYYSFEYEKRVSGDEEGDLAGSFDADLFDLVINIQATERLRIATDITWEHGAASEDGRGNVASEYAIAEYTFNNLFKVRAGKQFTNFGIYNEVHTAKPATLTVKEPFTTNKNTKLGSAIRFYPRWNNGIAFSGAGLRGENSYDYIVQISNGEHQLQDSDGDVLDADEGGDIENPFDADVDTSKALGGRFRYWPNDEWVVGFSFYMDKLPVFDADEDQIDNIDLSSYSLHSEWYPMNGFGLEFEYVMGSIDTDSGTDFSRNAYTIMFSQVVAQKFTPYFRYEFLEPNDDIDDDEATMMIVGVNYRMDTNLFLKGEITSTETDDANAKFEGADYKEFRFSISIGF